MAKPVNRKSEKTGKSGGKGQGGKASARRADAKPARGKGQKARPQSRSVAKQPKERGGFMKFLRDVRIEMGKVTWPTRRDLAQSFLVVLVAVFIAAVYVGIIDQVFSRVVDFVLSRIT